VSCTSLIGQKSPAAEFQGTGTAACTATTVEVLSARALEVLPGRGELGTDRQAPVTPGWLGHTELLMTSCHDDIRPPAGMHTTPFERVAKGESLWFQAVGATPIRYSSLC